MRDHRDDVRFRTGLHRFDVAYRPDCPILDLDMPGMTGTDVQRRLTKPIDERILLDTLAIVVRKD